MRSFAGFWRVSAGELWQERLTIKSNMVNRLANIGDVAIKFFYGQAFEIRRKKVSFSLRTILSSGDRYELTRFFRISSVVHLG